MDIQENILYNQKKEALSIAKTYIDEVFAKYPPEQFSKNLTSAGPLITPVRSTVTQAQQVILLMIELANWLLTI